MAATAPSSPLNTRRSVAKIALTRVLSSATPVSARAIAIGVACAAVAVVPFMRTFPPGQRMSIGHHADVAQAVTRYTPLASITGSPALSILCGFSTEGQVNEIRQDLRHPEFQPNGGQKDQREEGNFSGLGAEVGEEVMAVHGGRLGIRDWGLDI